MLRSRFREGKRFREQRFSGIQPGIPIYQPVELETRGFKLKFYNLSDVKIGEIGSDVKESRISEAEFELLDLGCGAFSFVIDEMPKHLDFITDLLVNGDFEDSNIGDPPAGWTAGGSALLTTQADGKSGKCMRIQEDGEMNPYGLQYLIVTPGSKYEVVAYVKAGTESDYYFHVMDSVHLVSLYTEEGTAAGDWSTKVRAVVTIPEDCNMIHVVLRQKCAQFAGTTIFWDEATCKQGEYVDAFDIQYRTRVDIHPYFDEIPWFTGFVQTLPQPGKKKPYEYTGYGFYDQLDWVTVTGSYEDQDIAVIVKNIIETMVAPNTQIIYNASKVETTGYVVDSIDFYLVKAKDAIQTLAKMAQGYEFGVDNSREFYFRPIDTDVYHSYWAGKHFQEIEIEEDPTEVRNRLYIKVGLIQGAGYGYIKEGSNCIGYVEDPDSIASYGLREEVITAPEALNVPDATQWAEEILANRKNPKISAKLKNVFFDTTKTKVGAKGKIRITLVEGIEYILDIDKISYSITPSGILGDMELR